MRISIREALFTGDEVDAWEPPKHSGWILAKDWKETFWSQEFVDMGVVSSDKSSLTRKFVSFERELVEWISDRPGYQCNPTSNKKVWYNKDLDIMFIIFESGLRAESKYEQPLMDWIQNLPSNRLAAFFTSRQSHKFSEIGT